MPQTIDIPSRPGSYVLILQLPRERVIRAGRLGPAAFPAGHYLYVGSARGPGGLRARLRRHLRQEKALHWHVDYLLQWARPVALWFALSTEPLECRWRELLQDKVLAAEVSPPDNAPGAQESKIPADGDHPDLGAQAVPVPGFGSSDCRCPAHLLYSPTRPAPAGRQALARATGVTVHQLVLADPG